MCSVNFMLCTEQCTHCVLYAIDCCVICSVNFMLSSVCTVCVTERREEREGGSGDEEAAAWS